MTDKEVFKLILLWSQKSWFVTPKSIKIQI
jgi:hypothetical protein